MLAMPSDTPACPDTDRRRRLAHLLADMIPGAAVIRVHLDDPERSWPHAHARAWAANGEPIALTRTASKVTARWVMRVWPEADWRQPHTLDLATAVLAASVPAPTGRGR